MPQKTRAQIAAEIAANLPNNVSQLITSAKHREVLGDVSISSPNILDDLIVESAGPSSAGKVPVTDGSGKLDASFIPGGTPGSAAWGDITGAIGDQIDLADALDSKAAIYLTPRVVGDASSTTILLTDLVILYERTDGAVLVFPNPTNFPEGKSVIIANNSPGSFNLTGAVANSFFNGSFAMENVVPVETEQTLCLCVIGALWRIIYSYNTADSIWGNIVGNILDQSDLQDALNLKANLDNLPIPIQIFCSDTGTPITAGLLKGYWMATFNGNLSNPIVYLNGSPTGSAAIFDLNKNGTTMLSTLVTVEDGENSSLDATNQPVVSVPDFVLGDIVSWDFDQVGSTDPGTWVLASFTATPTP